METDLNKLRDRVYKIACERGLHDEEIFTGNNIMLIIEGIINASKANRNNRHANVKEFLLRNDKSIMRTEDRDYFNYIAFCQEIKDSVEDELADIVIRLLEFGGIKKIDMNIPKWSSPISEVDERIIEIGTFDNFCYMLISSLITGLNDGDVHLSGASDIVTKGYLYGNVHSTSMKGFDKNSTGLNAVTTEDINYKGGTALNGTEEEFHGYFTNDYATVTTAYDELIEELEEKQESTITSISADRVNESVENSTIEYEEPVNLTANQTHGESKGLEEISGQSIIRD